MDFSSLPEIELVIGAAVEQGWGANWAWAKQTQALRRKQRQWLGRSLHKPEVRFEPENMHKSGQLVMW